MSTPTGLTPVKLLARTPLLRNFLSSYHDGNKVAALIRLFIYKSLCTRYCSTCVLCWRVGATCEMFG